MKQRCINHLFGYCYGKPNAEVSSIVGGISPFGAPMQYKAYILDSCVNNWQTCSQFVRASESIKSADPVDHPG